MTMTLHLLAIARPRNTVLRWIAIL